MSFSAKVKEEIANLNLSSNPKIQHELYGILLFGGHAVNEELHIPTENEDIFKRTSKLTDHAECLQNASIICEKQKRAHGKILYIIKISNINKNALPLLDLENEKTNIFTNIPENYLSDFLRGVFLACGSITNPEVDYHLEFNAPSSFLAELLFSLLENYNDVDFKPGMVERRNNRLVYLKGSEKITNFLVFIGAQMQAMELIQVKMVKEVRNNINRTTNFETANILKSTVSAARQIKAIKKIADVKGLDWLPNNLTETAKLRLNNPYSSLNELASLYKKPLSKSGINHRMKKIISISKTL